MTRIAVIILVREAIQNLVLQPQETSSFELWLLALVRQTKNDLADIFFGGQNILLYISDSVFLSFSFFFMESSFQPEKVLILIDLFLLLLKGLLLGDIFNIFDEDISKFACCFSFCFDFSEQYSNEISANFFLESAANRQSSLIDISSNRLLYSKACLAGE